LLFLPLSVFQSETKTQKVKKRLGFALISGTMQGIKSFERNFGAIFAFESVFDRAVPCSH